MPQPAIPDLAISFQHPPHRPIAQRRTAGLFELRHLRDILQTKALHPYLALGGMPARPILASGDSIK